jgi:AraC-like DNA-binding protein
MEKLTRFQADVLTDILQELHFTTTLYCYARLAAPWGFGIPDREAVSFHLVTSGHCWLHVENEAQPVELREGDLAIVPHGHAHSVTDSPTSAVTQLEDLLQDQPDEGRMHYTREGRGPVSTLICGGIYIQNYLTNPLFLLLPSVIPVRSSQGHSMPRLRAIVDTVRIEADQNRLAAEVIITRLSEVLFIQAVRAYLDTVDGGQQGWFRALKDPSIGQALALLHHEPDRAWAVESLAHRVNMSRSAFSGKFTHLVGEPPMQYLAHVRLTKASTLLRASSSTLSQVARAVGYDSAVAFSKAFKRCYGMSPGAYRHSKVMSA